VIRYSLATEGQLLTVRVAGIQFELEDRVDLAEVDEFLVVEDDVLEEDFDAVETFVETEVVDNFEEVEEETLVEIDVEVPSFVDDEDMALDDTSTHNATRKGIKNFESMMIMWTEPFSAVGN
jgi:hypothetical protein